MLHEQLFPYFNNSHPSIHLLEEIQDVLDYMCISHYVLMKSGNWAEGDSFVDQIHPLI